MFSFKFKVSHDVFKNKNGMSIDNLHFFFLNCHLNVICLVVYVISICKVNLMAGSHINFVSKNVINYLFCRSAYSLIVSSKWLIVSTLKKNWSKCPMWLMMWAVDWHHCRKNWSYIDGATKFMQEPGADGTPGSSHMIQVSNDM